MPAYGFNVGDNAMARSSSPSREERALFFNSSNARCSTLSKEKDTCYAACKDLEDYAIRATDGTIGHVTDFYFDDEAWVIRYLVVDTGTWL